MFGLENSTHKPDLIAISSTGLDPGDEANTVDKVAALKELSLQAEVMPPGLQKREVPQQLQLEGDFLNSSGLAGNRMYKSLASNRKLLGMCRGNLCWMRWEWVGGPRNEESDRAVAYGL